jgi:hypothetical protein
MEAEKKAIIAWRPKRGLEGSLGVVGQFDK